MDKFHQAILTGSFIGRSHVGHWSSHQDRKYRGPKCPRTEVALYRWCLLHGWFTV